MSMMLMMMMTLSRVTVYVRVILNLMYMLSCQKIENKTRHVHEMTQLH